MVDSCWILIQQFVYTDSWYLIWNRLVLLSLYSPTCLNSCEQVYVRERVGVKIPGKSSEHLFIFLVGKVRGVLAMHSTYAMLVKVVSEKGIAQYKKAIPVRLLCQFRRFERDPSPSFF